MFISNFCKAGKTSRDIYIHLWSVTVINKLGFFAMGCSCRNMSWNLAPDVVETNEVK